MLTGAKLKEAERLGARTDLYTLESMQYAQAKISQRAF